jgi:uncharacterized protein YutD
MGALINSEKFTIIYNGGATFSLERKKELFEEILKNYHYAVIKNGKRELRIPKTVTTVK